MIGDYVQYWTGREGVVDQYSDFVRVCEVLADSVTVEGDVRVPLENVKRIELTPEILQRLARKFIYGTALISFTEPYISYSPTLKFVCIILSGQIELRLPCEYLDQLQHIIGEVCEDYELKLKDYE